MPNYSAKQSIKADSPEQAKQIISILNNIANLPIDNIISLSKIAQNINQTNINILGAASEKIGINLKITTFKSHLVG